MAKYFGHEDVLQTQLQRLSDSINRKIYRDLSNNSNSMVQNEMFFKHRLDGAKKPSTTMNRTRHRRKYTSQSNNK